MRGKAGSHKLLGEEEDGPHLRNRVKLANAIHKLENRKTRRKADSMSSGKYYIQNGYIYGPEMSGRFYIENGYIYGPKNSGKYYIENGYIYGHKQSGKFYIEDNYIYGPDEQLPWMEE
jgi:hypothetical protein